MAAATRPNRRRVRPSAAPSPEPAQAMTPFKLDDTLDLGAAAALKSALLERRGSDLRVDASSVQHLGGQCAQVLAAATATWTADGVALTFPDASDAFQQGARLLGLHSTLLLEGTRT